MELKPQLFLIFIILLASCSAQAPKPQETKVISENEADEIEIQEPSADNQQVNVSENLTKTPETAGQDSSANLQINKTDKTTEPAAPQPIAAPDYPDSFDGSSINTAKYSTLINGPGSIVQDNGVISSGLAADNIIWNILYTNKEIDFTKDFKISVDVNLTESVERGDAMAIIAIEKMDEIQAGKMPDYRFCEISAGSSHGTMLRMRLSGHGSQLFSTAGRAQISFNALKGDLECSFEDKNGQVKTVNEDQKIQFGKYHLTLRSGIHSITSGGTETPATGSFKVIYDNLDLANK